MNYQRHISWLHFKGMKVGKLQGTIFDYLDNIRSSRSLCIGSFVNLIGGNGSFGNLLGGNGSFVNLLVVTVSLSTSSVVMVGR